MRFSYLAKKLNCIAISAEKLKLYHGSKSEWTGFKASAQKSGYYPGFYTSSREDLARSFGNVVTFSGLLKVYDLKDPDNLKTMASSAGFGRHSGNGSSEVQYLKSLGYDAMSRGNEIIVFNTDKLTIV